MRANPITLYFLSSLEMMYYSILILSMDSSNRHTYVPILMCNNDFVILGVLGDLFTHQFSHLYNENNDTCFIVMKNN